MASRSAVVLLLATGIATAAATAPTTRAAMTEGAYATLVQANAASNPHAIYSVEEDGMLPFFQHPRTLLTDDATAGKSNDDLSAVEVRSLLAPLGPHPSVDWRTKGAVTPVKNQGRYGTCWSFAAAENLEGLNFRQGHALQNISNQELIDCCADCQGRSADASFTFMLNNTGGQLDTQDSYPYEGKVSPCAKDGPSKVKSTMKLTTFGRIQDTDGTGNAIVAGMMKYGPMGHGVDANCFAGYKGGVITNCTSSAIDHAVLMVAAGYDEEAKADYYTIKNSWGPKFGEGGYVRIARGAPKQAGIASTVWTL